MQDSIRGAIFFLVAMDVLAFVNVSAAVSKPEQRPARRHNEQTDAP
jgi:hypothetical protein